MSFGNKCIMHEFAHKLTKAQQPPTKQFTNTPTHTLINPPTHQLISLSTLKLKILSFILQFRSNFRSVLAEIQVEKYVKVYYL